jgi:phosphatidylglycerophosphatase B
LDCLYVRFYRKCEAFFKEKQIRFDILKFLYKVLPVLEAAVYCGLIIYSFVKEDYLMLTKCIVVPATAFVVVSIFRKLIDSSRPYTKYDITPLINKDKIGESFPSRHTLSAFLITMTGFYVYFPVGIVLAVMSLIIAITRVVSGVHFTKDVIAGAVIGILSGIIYFVF